MNPPVDDVGVLIDGYAPWVKPRRIACAVRDEPHCRAVVLGILPAVFWISACLVLAVDLVIDLSYGG